MRDALSGNREPQRGSVPTIRPQVAEPAMGGPDAFAAAAPYASAPGMAGGMGGPSGGSFLGTAAAAAAGVIGGSLLLNGIRGMMGPHHGVGGFPASASPFGGSSASNTPASTSGTPWGDSTAHGGNLAQEAGLDDIGRSGHDQGSATQSRGLFDGGQADAGMQDANADYQDDAEPDDFDDESDFDGDGGGFGDDGGGFGGGGGGDY